MSTGPFTQTLPRLVEARKFTQQAVVLEAPVPLSELTRLSQILCDNSGEARVRLEFGRDDEGRHTVTGNIEAGLTVVCQRCLEPVTVSLQAELGLAIVWDEAEAKKLPRQWDPWIITEDRADLYELVAEELLLELPLAAYHPEPCVDATLFHSGEVQAVEPEPVDNPFNVLQQLKAENTDKSKK